MTIDGKFLDQLRAAGLHVSHHIPAFRGVWVCKPVTTPGHNHPDYTGGYVSIDGNPQCPEIDAPMLKFIFTNDKWQVHLQECIPDLGEADFIDEWSTPEEAVKDILDFYFGDPARMEKKAASDAKIDSQVKALKESKSARS